MGLLAFHNISLQTDEFGISTILLNRPASYNALNEETCGELIAAFSLARDNEATKVVVIKGAGRGFCAGQDIQALASDDPVTPSELMRRTYNPLILLMRQIPKPVICSLHGVAAGAGCSLVLACDMVIAADDAILSEAFIGIGLVPDSGSSYFLPRLVGPLKAFELLALGTKIVAKEALHLGMINKIVPPAELDSQTQQLAQSFVNSPLESVRLIKDMINQTYRLGLNEMLDLEARYQDIAALSPDFNEGIKAFVEKRKPVFGRK